MDRTTDDIRKEAAYLVYEFERRAYPLATDAFTIGRDAGNNIVVREPAVSRSHAELRAEGDEYFLHASGATGTKLNGAGAGTTPVKLTDGDKIEIGSAELTFRRGRLPLGVSVIDSASAAGHDPDAMTKRDTITNPILGSTPAPAKKKKSAPLALIFLILLVGAAAWFLFMR